jgi:hypothetical protein
MASNSSAGGKMSREEAGRMGGQAYHQKRGNHGSDSSSTNAKGKPSGRSK